MPTDFERAHQEVLQLIASFEAHSDKYLAPSYQEAEARKDFIDPLFEALGWDVSHRTQKNPWEQEVKVERSVNVDIAQKKADYSFSLAPNFRDVRFFVEAKKPSINLLKSANAHFQTIRYGWSAGTALAVLTDFEQLLVLDCRRRPHPETVLEQVHLRFHYKELRDPENFSQLYWIFSREAHASGAYDRLVNSLPKPKGGAVQRNLFGASFQAVDESFLSEIEEHRETLAKIYKNADLSLSSETLTEITQRTIDRFVFMRFIEDKLIEPDLRVADLGKRKNAWLDFLEASKRLDAVYNGIIFKPLPDLDKPSLEVDVEAFAAICERLSHLNSPYDFNAIPIHILGSIYERFLGKVIVATEKRAKLEEKHEVRKAGGVYYTPEYIVRHIINHTLEPLVAGKEPKEIWSMRFADISCGSGSFLLGVYDYLLEYLEKWYNALDIDATERADRDAKAINHGCIKTDAGTWRLGLRLRRDILSRCIFGVDLDRQAVEVTQLSLFLKLLEHESASSAFQFRMDFGGARTHLLPDLSRNIIPGNSLIEWDYSNDAFDVEEARRVSPFEFKTAFPEILTKGGFDAIIGNPPYGAQLSAQERKYLSRKMPIGTTDTAALMSVKAKSLVRPGGMLGLIVPKPLCYSSSWAKTRQALEGSLLMLCDVGKVWKEVKLEQIICIFGEDCASYENEVRDGQSFQALATVNKNLIEEFGLWINGVDGAEISLGKKMRALHSLGNFASNNRGAMLQSSIADYGVPVLGGKHIQRYEKKQSQSYIPPEAVVPPNGRVRSGCVLAQNIVAHVANPVDHIKIIATLVEPGEDFLILDTVNQLDAGAIEKNRLVLAIINSKLASWYMYRFVYGRAIRTMHFDATSTDNLPVPDLNSMPAPSLKQADILVSSRLAASTDLTNPKYVRDEELLKRRAASLDRQIDDYVYQLYDLSPSEIALVECGMP